MFSPEILKCFSRQKGIPSRETQKIHFTEVIFCVKFNGATQERRQQKYSYIKRIASTEMGQK